MIWIFLIQRKNNKFGTMNNIRKLRNTDSTKKSITGYGLSKQRDASVSIHHDLLVEDLHHDTLITWPKPNHHRDMSHEVRLDQF